MGRVLIIAASGRSAAERWARGRLATAPQVVTKDEVDGVAAVRRTVAEDGYAEVVVHSTDWSRQLNPQLFLTWLAAAPVARRSIADDASGRIRRLPRSRAAWRAAAGAALAPLGIAEAAGEIAPIRRRTGVRGSGAPEPAVLAIWLGGSETTVGGSVTHLSGILSGYREHGLRVGLVTRTPPSSQVAAVVDDHEIVPPLADRHRTTAEIESLAVNRGVRTAARRLVQRLRPQLVHQRHRGFLSAGFDVAESLGVPIVLEWNSSEQWVRRHWASARAGGRIFDRFLPASERSAVRRADLIAAVSPLAAEMAVEVGADPARVAVVPNAVDVEVIDAARRSVNGTPPGERLIGWVGSFGPWHGADLLVRALALLPSDVRMVMVGDGSGRRSCETLAHELGVHERIEWTGLLDHDAALRRLATCAVLASPQRDTGDRPFFGSPTKLFEYMALGRPVVATDVGSVGDLIDDGRTGVLVPQEDPQALADALLFVLREPERAGSLAAAAREEAESRHTWRDRAGQILERVA